MTTLGERIKRERDNRGISIRQLAQAADMGEAHVYRIETGSIADPGASVVAKLAAALGTTPNDLLGVAKAKVKK